MLLSELLPPERIRIPLEGRSKDDLLRELVDVLHSAGGVGDPAAVLGAVREREAVLSTGIGNGVAIPHGKSAEVARLAMAAGVAAEPADFEALDGRPVSLFFLLVGPESAAGDHVKALSRISRLVRSDAFRRRLAEAKTPEEFHAILAEAEQS
ncbi:MAG TPA: PTS sugar transporter subunit IIA [Longimicrobiaceae bacterium]|nr:PTS sugar transporter subunit IIA [Longimicrobiaceae bacterium]